MVFLNFKKIILIFFSILIISGGFFVFKIASTFNVISVSEESFWQQVSDLLVDYKKDQDRLDILILGIRGVGEPDGGLLADGIELLSFKKDTGQAAIISLPRDLYVEIPGLGKKEKLNYANAYGEMKKKGGGLLLTKNIVSNIVGLNIDYAVSVDFRAFKEIIDWLGGITIYLDKPFEEQTQWAGEGKEESQFWILTDLGWKFYIPAGENKLDGEAALYYIRSRFSTSDFDRSRRHQQVLLAAKNRALELGLLQSPNRIFELLDIVKRNILTDMTLQDIKYLIELAQTHKDKDVKDIKKIILDASESGLFYESRGPLGEYILLPKAGDWSQIQDLVRNIFVQ